ncbi:MAG: sigma-70 family RNA polymerase sigma factor [Candidatus Hydrogenedentes bacterium]|nr:sigma-70 family RNA polymerase sigma factor [Candidatus Hydrogenedentota bacterium]
MSDSNVALVERWVRQRDAEAFRALVVRYAGMVYGTCRRLLGNAAEAEDVSQECFEILARAGNKPGRYLGPWLHRVATNQSLKRLRADRRRKSRDAQFAATFHQDYVPDWNDIYTFIDEAIAELPQQLRVPLVKHFLEVESYETIARDLGVSRQVAAYRTEKAITHIRKYLTYRGITVTGALLAALVRANVSEAAPSTLVGALSRIALAGQLETAVGSGILNAMSNALFPTGLTVFAAILVAVAGVVWTASRAIPPQPDPEFVPAFEKSSTAATLADAPQDEEAPRDTVGTHDGNSGGKKPGCLTISALYPDLNSTTPSENSGEGVPATYCDVVLIPQQYAPAQLQDLYAGAELDRKALDILVKWNYSRPESRARRDDFLTEVGITDVRLTELLNMAAQLPIEMHLAYGLIFPNGPSATWRRATTDQIGKVVFDGLLPGRYLIALRQKGDGRSWEELADDFRYGIAYIREGNSEEMTLKVEDWVSRVHGRVVDGETNQPIDVDLALVSASTGDKAITFATRHGEFSRLDSVAYGSFTLAVNPSYRDFPYQIPKPVKGERKLGVQSPDIVLALFKSASTISGAVTTSGGNPVPFVFIQCWPSTENIAKVVAQTDSFGRYCVKHDGGTFRVRAAVARSDDDRVGKETYARSEWVEMDLQAGESSVQDLVFPDTAKLILHCRLPDGKPVTGGAAFYGMFARLSPSGESQPYSQISWLANGAVEIPYLTSGRYDVVARVDKYDPVVLDAIVIGTDGHDTETDVTLVPSTLQQKVRVLHSNGSPWSGVSIGIREYYRFNTAGDGPFPGSNLAMLTGKFELQQGGVRTLEIPRTDQNGEATLGPLWPGLFEVAAINEAIPGSRFPAMVELPVEGPLVLRVAKEKP